MIELVTQQGRIILLQEVVPARKTDHFLITDYDPFTQKFSLNTRHVKYMLNEDTTVEKFMYQLGNFPNAHIRKIISHEPNLESLNQLETIYELSLRQRVFVDGVPYIDWFGYHVYVSVYISLKGDTEDFDMRGILDIAPLYLELETFKPNRI